MVSPNHCPVCLARFRGARICSRCGADLGRLMFLAAQSWKLREMARTALGQGQFASCARHARDAENLLSTTDGLALKQLGEWLSGAPYLQ